MTQYHFNLITLLLATAPSSMAFVSNPSSVMTSMKTMRHSTTSLEAKDANRARKEREFEESMGDDWRLFRAKLVAREQADAEEKSRDWHRQRQQQVNNMRSNYNGGQMNGNVHPDEHWTQNHWTHSHHHQHNNHGRYNQHQQRRQQQQQRQNQQDSSVHDELANHSQLSDLFGAAISHIFSNHNNNQKVRPNQPNQQHRMRNQNYMRGQPTRHHRIGDMHPYGNVGGHAAYSSQQTYSQPQQTPQTDNFFGSGNGQAPQMDPFLSVAEIPIHLKAKESGVDKHRWAHPINHIEPGCVLIANEKLGGVFHQTIVVIVDHHEATGTTGVVINRPFEGKLNEVASDNECNLDLSLKLAFKPSPVTYGGPVLMDDFSILHSFGQVEGSKKLAPGVFIGGSEELMNEVRCNRYDASQVLFVKGHAAWVPGQLEREVAKGVWYTAAVSPDLMLRYAGAPITEEDNPDDLWCDILSCLGDRFVEIARRYGGRGDRRMAP